jgi:hypothetical protein
MEKEWQKITAYLKSEFNLQASVHNALFLIGVNELGYGFEKLDQQLKTKVINFASIYIMNFLSEEDKNILAENSTDGEIEEDQIYKKAIVNYFTEKDIIKQSRND